MTKLSILICSLASREYYRNRLLELLESQINVENQTSIEVLQDIDHGEASIGSKRQRLIEVAKGDYVCFIDDDDRISPDYIEKILKAIESRPRS